MIKLDHLSIPVTDPARSRDWYVSHFGFQVEFEVPERATIALRDDAGFTLFVYAEPDLPPRPRCTLAFQVDDVERKHRELAAAGVPFDQAPQRLFWGYGAELRDPDGYLVYVWDERSMKDKGGS